MQLEFVLTKWTGQVTLPVCGRMTSSRTDWQHCVLELMCEPVWERDTCLLFSLESAITGAIKVWRHEKLQIHSWQRTILTRPFWYESYVYITSLTILRGPTLIPMCNIIGNIYTQIYQSFLKFSLLKNFTVTSTFTGNKWKEYLRISFLTIDDSLLLEKFSL